MYVFEIMSSVNCPQFLTFGLVCQFSNYDRFGNWFTRFLIIFGWFTKFFIIFGLVYRDPYIKLRYMVSSSRY